MPIDVIIPKLDWIMKEATIVEWLKRDGEEVKEDEPLGIIETEKTTTDIISPVSGIFYKKRKIGSVVRVGEVIAVIIHPSEESQEIPEAKEIERQVRASPLAKKLAEEHGIDLSQITGTGPSGMVGKKDVLAYMKISPKVITQLNERIIPLTGWRKTMADRMSHSARNYVQTTTFAEADVTELVKLREKLKGEDTDISYTAFIVKAVPQALKEYPILNSSLVENKIVLKKYYNIGVAVARELKGLIVPVIHNADKKNLMEIAKDLDKLVEKARSGRLSLQNVREGTFTITNVGRLGVIMDTPIINPPESAILGVGAIAKRPLVVKNQIVIRSVMYLCLTYDHRIIDGLPAIKFLQRVRQLLENPHLLLKK